MDFKKTKRTMYVIQNSAGATMYSYLTKSVRDQQLEYLRSRYPKTVYAAKTVMV